MNAGIWIGIIGGIVGLLVAIGSVVSVGGSSGIYIAIGIACIGGGMFFLFYKLLFAPMILAARLKKTGIPGKALIKDVQDTGVTVNNSPQVKLTLEVKNTYGQVYTATVRTLISRLQPQLFQPGMTVPVLIDPNDEKKLIIDYSGGTETTKTRTSPSFCKVGFCESALCAFSHKRQYIRNFYSILANIHKCQNAFAITVLLHKMEGLDNLCQKLQTNKCLMRLFLFAALFLQSIVAALYRFVCYSICLVKVVF